jgi:hypothetical protein
VIRHVIAASDGERNWYFAVAVKARYSCLNENEFGQ